MEVDTKRLRYFSLELCLLAANMRMAILIIAPLTQSLGRTLHLTTTQLGFLTTIPLLCFGLGSVFMGRLIQKIGTTPALALALLGLLVASLGRVYSVGLLFGGTILAGLSITLLNVLLPALIVEQAPGHVAQLNGVYPAASNVFAAIASGVAVPFAQLWGWQRALQLMAVPTVLALMGWYQFRQLRYKKVVVSKQTVGVQWWRLPRVWVLALFMGSQSLIFYALAAWLPRMLTSQQVSTTTAGTLAAVFQIIGFPAAYIVPRFAQRSNRLKQVLLVLLGGYGLGFILLLQHAFWCLVLASLLLGLTTAAIFSLALSLITVVSPDPASVSLISGGVQSVGYLLASSGPTLCGAVQAQQHRWQPVILGLLVLAVIAILLGFLLRRLIQWQRA